MAQNYAKMNTMWQNVLCRQTSGLQGTLAQKMDTNTYTRKLNVAENKPNHWYTCSRDKLLLNNVRTPNNTTATVTKAKKIWTVIQARVKEREVEQSTQKCISIFLILCRTTMHQRTGMFAKSSKTTNTRAPLIMLRSRSNPTSCDFSGLCSVFHSVRISFFLVPIIL